MPNWSLAQHPQLLNLPATHPAAPSLLYPSAQLPPWSFSQSCTQSPAPFGTRVPQISPQTPVEGEEQPIPESEYDPALVAMGQGLPNPNASPETHSDGMLPLQADNHLNNQASTPSPAKKARQTTAADPYHGKVHAYYGVEETCNVGNQASHGTNQTHMLTQPQPSFADMLLHSQQLELVHSNL